MMGIGSTVITSYLQKGDTQPIRAKIRLVTPNQIELKQRNGIAKPWYMLTTATRTGAKTTTGSLVFSNAYTEFYISPADCRRLTGEGFDEVARRGQA